MKVRGRRGSLTQLNDEGLSLVDRSELRVRWDNWVGMYKVVSSGLAMYGSSECWVEKVNSEMTNFVLFLNLDNSLWLSNTLRAQ